MTDRAIEPHLTTHAIKAMLTRDISRAEVCRAIAEPDSSYTQNDYGDDRTVYRVDDYVVVTGKSTTDARPAVITVLFHDQDDWQKDEGRASGKRLSAEERAFLEDKLRRRLVPFVDQQLQQQPPVPSSDVAAKIFDDAVLRHEGMEGDPSDDVVISIDLLRAIYMRLDEMASLLRARGPSRRPSETGS